MRRLLDLAHVAFRLRLHQRPDPRHLRQAARAQPTLILGRHRDRGRLLPPRARAQPRALARLVRQCEAGWGVPPPGFVRLRLVCAARGSCAQSGHTCGARDTHAEFVSTAGVTKIEQ